MLRGATACSALAAVLLGLAAGPAHAQLAPLEARTGAANPLDGQDIGFYAAPAFGDLDGDGDRDLLAGSYAGSFHYFENTGDAATAAFELRTGPQDPLDGQAAGAAATPALADLDGDGDLDLIAGSLYGALHYFENTGGVTSAAFAEQTGSANPLDGADVGDGATTALADLDADGDFDLFCGRGDGSFSYFENTGGAAAPQFAAPLVNPFGLAAAGISSSPALGDLDADGDLDLITGDYYGGFSLFENTGSATQPAFALAGDPVAGSDIDYLSAPAFADLDADGDLDAIAGDLDGTFHAFENAAGRLVERTGAANPLDGQGSGSDSALGDLDDDGDLDLVTGAPIGTFGYFENTGSAAAPAFVERTGAENPLDGLDAGTDTTPSLGDLDADGDLDLLTGGTNGEFEYFQNTGTATTPAFVERTGAQNPFVAFDEGFDAAPALGDADGDGDLDLVAGERYGAFAYFRNSGSAASPAFVHVTSSLGGIDVGSRSRPALSDLDGDGDRDLVAGDASGSLRVFVATAGGASPAFVERTGAASPIAASLSSNSSAALGDLDGDGDADLVAGGGGAFHYFESHVRQPSLTVVEPIQPLSPIGGEDPGEATSAALGDLDGDGDLDLVAGETSGAFIYFENTGSATSPDFAPRTGASNPLDGQAVSSASRPALGDLDGDGDPDLLAGQGDGAVRYFENTGDAVTAAFVEQTGAANPLDGQDAGQYASPALGDVDGDGDLDAVLGEQSGALLYFENTGDAGSAAFIERTGASNPWHGVDLGSKSAPALGDFDRDGDLDLVSGEAGGSFALLRNEGSATAPAFAASGASGVNPLAAEDVGADSAPAAGDLDGNGHLDLVTGSLAGPFAVHYFPEPARGWLLAAGAALACALDAIRRRREDGAWIRPVRRSNEPAGGR